MTEGHSESRRSGTRGILVVIAVCIAPAATSTVILDRVISAKRRSHVATTADPNLLPAPDPARWRPAPFAIGSTAPDFALPDFQTGRLVSLDAFQGDRPVVILLSSFG
jgi:hypothetical protein